jgi:hypothetical protein
LTTKYRNVDRNDYARSGIDDLVAAEHWAGLAIVITRDQEAIEGGILPEGMNDFRSEMLRTIKMFRDRYFSEIDITVNLTPVFAGSYSTTSQTSKSRGGTQPKRPSLQ